MSFDSTNASACITTLQSLGCGAHSRPTICDGVLKGLITQTYTGLGGAAPPCNMAPRVRIGQSRCGRHATSGSSPFQRVRVGSVLQQHHSATGPGVDMHRILSRLRRSRGELHEHAVLGDELHVDEHPVRAGPHLLANGAVRRHAGGAGLHDDR